MFRSSHIINRRARLLASAAALALATVARGQTFQSTGTDFSPVDVNGTVVTNAHDDNSGTNYNNVRISAYAFQADPEDPNFTQDPGFNTPEAGLPAGAVLSFSVLDSLKYFGGTGPMSLTAPPDGESLRYSFGPISTVVIGGSSGPQPGFNIGGVASNGAFHKHLSAFLQDSTGSYDQSATPSPGVYVAQLQVNVTGLTSSAPIFAVYSNGASATAVDRTKFYLRNNLAPGSTLFGLSTSLVGLSAVPGDTDLASGGGTVAVSGSTLLSPVNTLVTGAGSGSVAISGLPASATTYAVLWLGGSSSDVATAISDLAVPGDYTIAPSNAAPSDPLYPVIQRLSSTYSGFSAVVEFDGPASNTAFNWEFAADPNVTLSQIAIAGVQATPASSWLDVSGSWGNSNNWVGGLVPDAPSAVASFGGSPSFTSSHVVTLDGSRTVGTVTFSSARSVTISAGTGGTLIMDNGTSAALISVLAGSHEIDAPVSAGASGLGISVAGGCTLTFGGSLTGAGVNITGSGAIALAVPASTGTHAAALTATSLTLASGSTVVVPYADHSQGLQSRLIATGVLSDSGVLDLTDNDMLIQGMTEAAIVNLVTSGSLTSSTAGRGSGADRFAGLAVVTNSDGAGGTLYASFDGVPAASSDVLVRYTYLGDTTLKGYVDGSDIANVLAGINGGLTGWVNGDFTYSGSVTPADLQILLASLAGQGASFGDPSGTAGPSGGAVPEPSSALLAVGAAPVLRRRRPRGSR